MVISDVSSSENDCMDKQQQISYQIYYLNKRDNQLIMVIVISRLSVFHFRFSLTLYKMFHISSLLSSFDVFIIKIHSNTMEPQMKLSQLLDHILQNNYYYLFVQIKTLDINSTAMLQLSHNDNNFQCHQSMLVGRHPDPQNQSQSIELWFLAIEGQQKFLEDKLNNFSGGIYDIKYPSKQIKIPIEYSQRTQIETMWRDATLMEIDSQEFQDIQTQYRYQRFELPDKQFFVAVFNEIQASIIGFSTIFQNSLQLYNKIKLVEYDLFTQIQQTLSISNILYIDTRNQKSVKQKVTKNPEVQFIRRIKLEKTIIQEYRYHENRKKIEIFLRRQLEGYLIYILTPIMELQPSPKEKDNLVKQLNEIGYQDQDMQIEQNQIRLNLNDAKEAKTLFEKMIRRSSARIRFI